MSLAQLPPGTDLSIIPLAPNPNGDPPNFVDPPSQEKISLGVGISLMILALFALALRLVSNLRYTRKLALDDYSCIAAFVLVTGYLGIGISLSHTARHMWDISLSTLNESFAKKSFMFNLISGPAVSTPKLAILALYIRLFNPERWLRMTCWIVAIITFLFYWSTIPTAAVQCSPQGGIWVTRAECGTSMTLLGVVMGAFGVAIDILLIILPLPVLYKLNLPNKKKIGLTVVFLTGILAVLASVISLYYRVVIYTAYDKFWNAAVVEACAFAEGYITIVVSCMPAIYSFWSNYFINSPLYSTLQATFKRSTGSQSSSLGKSEKNAHSNQSGVSNDAKVSDDYHPNLLPTH